MSSQNPNQLHVQVIFLRNIFLPFHKLDEPGRITKLRLELKIDCSQTFFAEEVEEARDKGERLALRVWSSSTRKPKNPPSPPVTSSGGKWLALLDKPTLSLIRTSRIPNLSFAASQPVFTNNFSVSSTARAPKYFNGQIHLLSNIREALEQLSALLLHG